MSYLTTGMLDQLAGLPEGTVKRMVAVGQLQPAVRASGRGQAMLWSESQALGVVSLTNLRRRGATMAASLAVMEFLASRSIDDLRSDWQAGRHCLLTYGDTLLPGQIELSSITENPVMRDLAAAQQVAVPIVVIDVKLAWIGLDERLREIERKRVEQSRCRAKLPAEEPTPA